MKESKALELLRKTTREREKARRKWSEQKNEDLLSLLKLSLPKLLPCDRFGLFIIGIDAQTLWLQAGSGLSEKAIEVSETSSLVGKALSSRSPVFSHGLADTKGAHQTVGRDVHYTLHDALTVPILSPKDGRPVGALQVLNRKGGSWTDDDATLLTDIGHRIAASVEMMKSSQDLLHSVEGLDAEIQKLDQQESAIRGGHMLRTFEPAIPLPAGGFLHGRYQGTMFPPFIDTTAVKDLSESWDCDANDIFICTHQKVGTHLAKKFAIEVLRAGLADKDDSIYSTGDIGHGTVPWPEVLVSQHGRREFDAHVARTESEPRLWYFHCSYEDLPIKRIHPQARFIVVHRDPKAVAVSQYFFWKKHPLLDVPQGLELDRLVEAFLGGDLYFGDYHAHVSGWLNRSDVRIEANQVLELRYDEMVDRKLECANAFARFIFPDRELSADDLAQIAASTEFGAMKSEITRNPQSFHLNPSVYFRSGKTNDWENHLSELSIRAIDEKSKSVWAGCTVAPPYTDRTISLSDFARDPFAKD